jgi:hypothetical protein
MRSLLQLALFIACFATAGAEPQNSALPISQNRSDAAPQARITGHVLLADTKEPARNAVVLHNSLDGQNRQFLRVGLDGTYLFEHVVPGEYIVMTYLDGYLSPFDKLNLTPADTTIRSLFEKVVAAQGSLKVGLEGTQTLDISMERGAMISGRLLYSDGSPAIQAGIELRDTAAPNSEPGMPGVQLEDLGDISRSEFVHQPLETDDQGHFRIAGIRPGTYRIAAVLLQKEPMQNTDVLARAIVGAIRYYTNDTIHAGLAKTYTLVAAHELSGLEIRIPLDGFHSVQGKVVARDGRPITSAEVSIVETSDPSLHFLGVASEGSFRFDRLPPGTYKLTAPWGNIAPPGGQATAAFGAGSTTFTLKDTDLNNVMLTLPARSLPKPMDLQAP